MELYDDNPLSLRYQRSFPIYGYLTTLFTLLIDSEKWYCEGINGSDALADFTPIYRELSMDKREQNDVFPGL